MLEGVCLTMTVNHVRVVLSIIQSTTFVTHLCCSHNIIVSQIVSLNLRLPFSVLFHIVFAYVIVMLTSLFTQLADLSISSSLYIFNCVCNVCSLFKFLFLLHVLSFSSSSLCRSFNVPYKPPSLISSSKTNRLHPLPLRCQICSASSVQLCVISSRLSLA